MFRAAAGAIDENTKHFESIALPELRIDSNRRVLPVSIDGEVTDMPTPLLYKIREKPMRVIVPKEEQSTNPKHEHETMRKIPMRNDPNVCFFAVFEFRICSGFRASDFGFCSRFT